MRARGIAVVVVVVCGMAELAAGQEVSLPARSRDGARLALPTSWTQESAFICTSEQVNLVGVGKVKGEVIDLSGTDVCGDVDQRVPTDESMAKLAAALADGGYAALPPVEQVAPDLEIVVKAKKKKTTVQVKLGKKTLGKGSIKGEAARIGAVLVTGKKPYLYVQLQTMVSDGNLTVSDQWLAIKLEGGPPEWKVFESLAAKLAREAPAGQEIAILPGTEGLTAISADGAWKKVLVAGAVAYAAVDHRAEVIWFGHKGALKLLDLRGDGTPETVVAKMPDGWISIGHGDGESLPLTGLAETMINVSVTAKPSASVEVISMCQGFDPPKRKVKTPKLKDKKRLAALAARVRPASPAPLAEGPRVSATGFEDSCADCGRSRVIPGSSLLLVFGAYFPGGDCGPFWDIASLYDPGTGEFVDGVDPSKRATAWSYAMGFEGAWFAPSGRAWIAGGQIARLDGAVVSAGGGQGGGWLGGGVLVGPWSL
jgi:hypothetical protein